MTSCPPAFCVSMPWIPHQKSQTKNICLLASCPAELPFICGFMQITLRSSAASSSLLIRLPTNRSCLAYENLFTLQLSLPGIDELQLCFASHDVLNQFLASWRNSPLQFPVYLHLIFDFSICLFCGTCAGSDAVIILLKDKH